VSGVGRRQALASFAALGACACGYALMGRGITTDPSIRRIGVPLFRDRTGRTGLDQRITQRVVEELLKRGRFTVVQDTAGVDALIDGELTAYTVTPVGFAAQGEITQASRYAVTVTARVTYRKLGQTEPIWASEGFSFREEYDMGEEAAAFFDREDQTLDRLAEAFAKSLVSTMLEAF
jgi:hypothetical protein